MSLLQRDLDAGRDPDGAEPDDEAGSDLRDTTDRLATNSVAVAGWTLVSRVTGFVRVALIGAILGPTFFGNLFQAANTLPWYVYELAIGSLLASLLVPPLVAAVDKDDPARLRRLANGFFGLMLAAFSAVALVFAALTPLVARLLGQSAPDRGQFSAVAVPLLLLTAPQLVGYGIVATAAAVQNARDRFAFAAAAPAVENVVVVGALLLYAVRYGTGTEIASVSTGQWLLLGVGSTLGVVVHASLQWAAAARAGVRLIPAAGWRDPDVREVVRLALPSAGIAGLNGLRLVLLVVATSQIAGGSVSFQIGLAFVNMAVALGAKPAATAALPELSRQSGSAFRHSYERAVRLAGLVAIPATVGLLLLARLASNGFAFGAMNTPEGRDLLLYAIAGTAAAILGESLYQIATTATFARRAAGPALAGTAVRTVLTVAGVAVAMTALEGTERLLGIAVAMAVADVLAGLTVHRGVVGGTIHAPDRRTQGDLARTAVAAGLAFLPVASVAHLLRDRTGEPPVATLAAAGLGGVGLAIFALARRALGPHELGAVVVARRARAPQTLGDDGAGEPPAAADAAGPRPGATPARLDRFGPALIVGLPCAVLAGLLIGATGTLGAGAIGALILAVTVWHHPPAGAWVVIALSPFIVGFDRGQALPLVRPNEAVFLLVVAVLGLRVLVYRSARQWRFHRVDIVVAAVVFTGSVLPLVVQFGRLRFLSTDDFFYAIALWKFGGIYAMVRSVIRTERQVRICLWLSVAAASILGVAAVADSLNIGGFAYQVSNYFPPGEGALNDGRGAVTIGNPIGMGGYLAVNLFIALGLLMRGRRSAVADLLNLERTAVGAAAALACVGVGIVGAGQFGPVLAMGGAAVAYGLATRSLGRIVAFGVPCLVLAGLLLWPVVERRLSGFDEPTINSGIKSAILEDPGAGSRAEALREVDPGSSWDVREYNLRTYFLPELVKPGNLIFGVTPQARVDAPEEWRDYIWIESGHLWLLWTGGLPFLIAFFALLVIGMRRTHRLQRGRADALGVASAAAFAGLWILAIGQIFDPYLTLRGVADIFWPVLALGVIPRNQEVAL